MLFLHLTAILAITARIMTDVMDAVILHSRDRILTLICGPGF